MCGPSGAMNKVNYSKMDQAEVNQRLEYSRQRLRFCAMFYKLKVDAGRYFIHEHPAGASSWHETCMTNAWYLHGKCKAAAWQAHH